jgi:hypothetical protein
MADKKLKTWSQKLEAGEPLNALEETQADADFNHKQRLKEQQERDAFNKRKQGVRPAPVANEKETK